MECKSFFALKSSLEPTKKVVLISNIYFQVVISFNPKDSNQTNQDPKWVSSNQGNCPRCQGNRRRGSGGPRTPTGCSPAVPTEEGTTGPDPWVQATSNCDVISNIDVITDGPVSWLLTM